jgi:hypothetical protein
MADSKSTRSRKRKKALPKPAGRKAVPEAAPHAAAEALPRPVRRAVANTRFITFPEVKGKAVDQVEIDPDGQSIVMVFADNTVLSFDLDPRLSLFPELSEMIRGDAHILKRWEPVHTKTSILRWL